MAYAAGGVEGVWDAPAVAGRSRSCRGRLPWRTLRRRLSAASRCGRPGARHRPLLLVGEQRRDHEAGQHERNRRPKDFLTHISRFHLDLLIRTVIHTLTSQNVLRTTIP